MERFHLARIDRVPSPAYRDVRWSDLGGAIETVEIRAEGGLRIGYLQVLGMGDPTTGRLKAHSARLIDTPDE